MSIDLERLTPLVKEIELDKTPKDKKTVRVRIAVFVNDKGQWAAAGYSGGDDENSRIVACDLTADFSGDQDEWHWIEADVPLPEPEQPKTIEGEMMP